MAEATVDISEWTRKIALLSAGLKKTMREALYEEWPLLLTKIMDFTPPFKTNDLRKGSSASDYSVGRAAVNRDIRKTMRPFNPSIRSPHLEKIIEKGDIEAFNAMAKNIHSGPMANAHAAHFAPELHTQQRNARGRVGKGYQYVILGPEVGMFKKYLKEVQDRVGYAKSGWLAALYLTGGDAPNWVSKHGTGGGAVIDNHADEENPSITAINRTPWAVRQDEGQRILQDAYQSRANAITTKVRVKVQIAAKEAGLAA